ncbi:hypothetical protein [Gorillibacterium sp. sgz5001074]|uniref:hypothetical protein n=1 Tax=Gorillibacterium sp. sgz5001074 TaxID=3446695 RepID=UPI003F66776C
MKLRLIRNERGAALLYVLFAFAILLVFVPVMLNMTTDKALRNKTDQNKKLVESVALTGLESLIGYLNPYTNQTGRGGHFKAFGGWTDDKYVRIVLPEGETVYYRQRICEDKACSVPVSHTGTLSKEIYYAEFRAIVGDSNGNHDRDSNEPYYREKKMVYAINVKEGGAALPAGIYPDQRIPTLEKVIYGGELDTQGGRDQSFFSNKTVQQFVSKEMNRQETLTTTAVSNYWSSPSRLTCRDGCTKADIDALVQSSSGSPAIIHVKNIDTTDSSKFPLTNGALTFHYSKPIVLMVDNLRLENTKMNVYGDLIVMQNVSELRNQNGFFVYDVDGAYGNLIFYNKNPSTGAYNTVSTGSQTDFYAVNKLYSSGDIYCRNNCVFGLKSNNTVIAKIKEIVIQGALNVDTQADLLGMGNVLLGSFYAKNNATIMADAGDLFVENSFHADTQLDVTTLGVVAVGGSIDLKNNYTFNTGNSTSLHLTDSTSGGSGGEPVNWNPTRQ